MRPVRALAERAARAKWQPFAFTYASNFATGQPALAVIIEPQLRDSETKRFSWPVYVTTARRLAGCPAAVLVVICPDPAEAAKCRQLIRTGHPGFDLAPIVIDSNAPPGFDGAGGPYLTLFAASVGGIDLASETGARAVLDAMSDPVISEAERLQLTIIIMRLASDAARQSLEAMMHTSEYEKTFVEELRDQGKAEGHVEGKAEGHVEGKAEGLVEGKAEGLVEGEARSVLRILDARRLAPSEEQRQRVISCTDAAQLDLWLDRAITADTVDEIFAD
jgi:hypothetical protein